VRGAPADLVIHLRVIAFNRVKPLRRLLATLLAADFMGHVVPLGFALDANSAPEVIEACRNLTWPYGPKTVTLKKKSEGLPVGGLGLVAPSVVPRVRRAA
jgi:hypothetical protein